MLYRSGPLAVSLCLLIVCGFVGWADAQQPSRADWPHIIAKADERAKAEFIQIPGPNPILVPGPERWDSGVVEAADIIKDHDTYYFYYHGAAGSYQVGVATADHPLGPWKKYEKNPIIEIGSQGGWEDMHVACAFIHKEKAGSYYMWYSAKGSGRDAELGRNAWDIGLATADNPLGPWKKHENNPILKDFGYVGSVVKYNGQYYLYAAHIIGSVGPDYSPMALAIADKPEGPYTKYDGNPIFTEGPWGAWDDGGYSEAEVLLRDGIFHMFYGGTKLHPTRILSRESIGYAYSFDGIHFTRYPRNPVAAREMQPDGGAFAEVHVLAEGPFFYLFHTLRYNSRGGDEDIGVQVLATQSPFKLRMPILIMDSVAGGGGTTSLDDCRPLCLDSITTLALTVQYTLNPISGEPLISVPFHVKASYDGLTYDTVDTATLQVVPQAGGTARQTFTLEPTMRYLKVQTTNWHMSEMTNVSVYATVGG